MVREQIELAVREALGGMVPRLREGAKWNAMAAVLALYGGGALVTTMLLLIALVAPAWVAALIVGVLLVIAAAIVRALAKSRTHPEPSHVPAERRGVESHRPG
ncbi:phage holin family protein [Nocardia sp. CT2-14]|uniref:Phage holin family protein n=2 Tax=Nocardia aurantiaca TaxID=2675850 RepID=A0A6I3L7C7_9NOCA|nr:phage holin family protein [Nocardia aurantiaca]